MKYEKYWFPHSRCLNPHHFPMKHISPRLNGPPSVGAHDIPTRNARSFRFSPLAEQVIAHLPGNLNQAVLWEYNRGYNWTFHGILGDLNGILVGF